MGHIKTTEEEKNFTIAVSANWSGMQLFLQPSSLFIRKKKHILISWRLNEQYHITNNTPACRWPRHIWHQDDTETQRSRETVGLVPPSVSVVGNLPVVPENASHNRNSALINTHPETKAHACPQTHMYSQSHPLFPLHPSSL